MNATRVCPDREELRSFLLGLLPFEQVDALESHLSECAQCASTIESVAAVDGFLETVNEGLQAYARSDTWRQDPLVEQICRMGRLAGVPDVRDPADTDLPGPAGLVGYEILERVGIGGMGIVYKAHQLGLERVVAIKMIRDRVAGDSDRQARFRAEALAAGRLQHPNIVQVFDVGRYAGSPYLVMEYVEGGTLAQALSKGALPSRRAAELVALLAGAVDAAHRQGIIHRDLKPANVLLTADGVPKIADFGLAKHLDNDGLTQAGELLGTPSYMAPELTRGEGKYTSPLIDVYALGAILYECLSGHPPFQADSALETLEEVRTREPVPLRRLRPSLARDLETICLKCLEKEPDRRYPSADELRKDLQRFIQGRPILARPAGTWEKLVKAARRKPAQAALGGLLLLTLIALAVGGTVYEWRLRVSLAETLAASARADQNYQRADRNYRSARDAIQAMIFQANDRRWAGVRRVQELKREQIERALQFYDEIARQEGNDPAVRHDVAWACLEEGKYQILLGRLAESRANVERAMTMAESLMRQDPTDLRVQLLIGDALLTMRHHDQAAQATARQERAVAVLTSAFRAHPKSEPACKQLADACMTLGGTLITERRYSDAERQLLRAIELLDGVLTTHPNDDPTLTARARARINLSECYRLQRQVEKARLQHERATADLETLYKRNPNDRDTIDGLAVLRINWAYEIDAAGKPAEALEYVFRNVPMLDASLKREPADTETRDRMYRTLGLGAVLQERLGRNTEAARTWERAIEYGPEAERTFQRYQLAELWVQAGDHHRAIVEADRVRNELQTKPNPELSRMLAQTYEKAADLAAKDPKLTPDERKVIAERSRDAIKSLPK